MTNFPVRSNSISNEIPNPLVNKDVIGSELIISLYETLKKIHNLKNLTHILFRHQREISTTVLIKINLNIFTHRHKQHGWSRINQRQVSGSTGQVSILSSRSDGVTVSRRGITGAHRRWNNIAYKQHNPKSRKVNDRGTGERKHCEHKGKHQSSQISMILFH